MEGDQKDTARKEPYRLSISLSSATDAERASLAKQGVPGYLHSVRPYILDETVRRFGVLRAGSPSKTLSKALQQTHARAVFKGEDPFVACVSSELNDARAKLFAAYSMLRWMRHAGRAPALWHAPTGSGFDRLLSKGESLVNVRPAGLVLANGDIKMTHRKREKIRDLLELHSDVPRLVTATGANPVDMMEYIGIHCHYCVWIRSSDTWSA